MPFRKWICSLIALSLVCGLYGPTVRAKKTTGIARYDAAVGKGVAYIRSQLDKPLGGAGIYVLAAYALLKAGEPASDPFIAGTINGVLQRSGGSQYQPISPYEHIYGAGVDAMLLADLEDFDRYRSNIQVIANYIVAAQRADGSWSNTPTDPGDVSMSQYGMLGLWAAQRAGCNVPPTSIDKGAQFLMSNGQPDGGWAYRPGTNAGPGAGSSTHNMTMAAGGSLAIARLLLHGQRVKPKQEKEEKAFGILEKKDPLAGLQLEPGGPAFPDFRAQVGASSLDQRVERSFGWINTRFQPVSTQAHKIYFYYALERAASLHGEDELGGRDWYTTYGDGLLSLQRDDGAWDTHHGSVTGTSFAILYFMKSTEQIIKKLYGLGIQRGDRGNPFGDKKKKREPTELDLLLADLEKMDFEELDESPVEVADELILSVTSIDDPEKLVGEKDRLLRLLKHPSAEVRQPVVWALGRTGDFSLVPQMLDSLRDVNLDVAVEALMALRYIARKPNGFGISLNPLEGAELGSEEEKLKAANRWRDKAYRTWAAWYFRLRPWEQQDGLDELEALTGGGGQ